jgi:hypothetical protein
MSEIRFEQNGTRGWNIYRDRPSIQNVKIGDIAIQGVDEPRLNLLDYVVTGEVLAIGRFMVELIKPPRAELEKPELPPDSPEAKLDAQEWVGPKGVKISGTELLRRIHIADSDYKAHYLISWNIGGKLRIDRKHLYVRTK